MFSHYSAYRFFNLPDAESLRESLKSKAKELDIRGTLLLGKEGANIGISGTPKNLHFFSNFLIQHVGFPVFEWKVTQVDEHVYKRFIVKVKPEIVTTGFTDVRPDEFTGEYLNPNEFDDWMQGKHDDFVLIDTRNDYEIRLGKFRGALDLNSPNFRTFLKDVSNLDESIKEKAVITYCTGGIRCEKATAIMMKKLGFKKVMQLEGGILNYLKEKSSKGFYEGDCFVFDERVGINADLKRTQAILCNACRGPLKPKDLEDERYVPNQSCPYCYE